MNKHFLFACLHSISQVFFIENKYSALFFLSAIAYTAWSVSNPFFFIAAIIGALASNLIAIQLKYNKEDIRSGLYGFNGVLIALAVSLFIQPSVFMWLIMLIAIYLSVVVTQAFKFFLRNSGIPYSTGPFVFCAWLILFAAYNFGSTTVNTGIHPHFVSNFTPTETFVFTSTNLGEAFLKNIGQVFFLSESISGLLILIGLFIGGIRLCVFAALGSLLAIATSVVFHVDANLLQEGLYGFSPVLTALALGCVFIKDKPVYAFIGVIITVFIQAALYSVTASLAVPTFTSAYVLCLYLFMAAYNNKEEC